MLKMSFTLTATTDAAGLWTGYLKPGSAYSPGGTLAAGQAATMDQWAAVYGRYKVNSATCVIRISGANGGTSYTYSACSYPSIRSTLPATYLGASSQPWAKTVLGGFQISNNYGVGNAPTTMIHKLNHDAIVGSKSDAYDTGALVTADPTANQYMVLPIFIKGDSASIGTYILNVDIWQNVTFSQRTPVTDV